MNIVVLMFLQYDSGKPYFKLIGDRIQKNLQGQ